MEILGILGVAGAASAFIIWRGSRSEHSDAPKVSGLLVGFVFFVAGVGIVEKCNLIGIVSWGRGILGLFVGGVWPLLVGRATMLWLEDWQKERSARGR